MDTRKVTSLISIKMFRTVNNYLINAQNYAM